MEDIRSWLSSPVGFLALLLSVWVFPVQAQQSDECPATWYEHADRCYKFVQHPTPVQRARIECQQDSATLVNIRSVADHLFIQEKLEIKTAAGQEWFTSGYRALDGSLKWAADGSDVTTDFFPSQAIRDQNKDDPGLNIPYNRIVYKYQGGGSNNSFVWGWNRIMSPGGYICQIDKTDTWKIYQQRRDFSYGTGVTDQHLWKTGPNITYHSANTLFFETESGTTPVVLDCQASGNPSPKYRWFRQKVGQSTRQEVTAALGKNYVITNGRLTILNPTDTRDSSIYTCQATNEIGTVLSNPIELAYGSKAFFCC
ncbi:contactin [Elysia marginata]|uniref:Contactin n=1 Tax=Elysia marginata TaxID=1093978 RepID=A0AAV4H4D8_9GAST|nr:contactin [Elysia marginata]